MFLLDFIELLLVMKKFVVYIEAICLWFDSSQDWYLMTFTCYKGSQESTEEMRVFFLFSI